MKEKERLKEISTTLTAKADELEIGNQLLAVSNQAYDKKMEEYNRIHNDQEAELKKRLKSHKEKTTKNLELKYAKKEKALEKAYNDKNKALWGVVLAISTAALIPLIGIIVNVEENFADFQRFVTPILALSDFVGEWAGMALVGYLTVVVIAIAVAVIIAALCKWFSNGIDWSRKFFCIALGVFEVLLVINPILPKEYNPFWISLVLFVGGMIAAKNLIK